MTTTMKVKDLISMVNARTLHTEQTTQRSFIYGANTTVVDGTEITKAAAVINSIITYHIQLPAIYFWKTTGEHANPEGEYELLDGKQRILSIKEFVEDDAAGYAYGKGCKFSDLSEEDQNYLLDYEFPVIIKEGPAEEEERTFLAINSNGLALTPYENLRGCYYGTFFCEFEGYILNKRRKDCCEQELVDIGRTRGDQAYWLLLMYFGLLYESKDKRFDSLCNRLKMIRNSSFDRDYNKFDEKISAFVALSANTKLRVDKNNLSKSPQKIYQLAEYIVDKSWDVHDCIAYYVGRPNGVLLRDNDVKSWSIDMHKNAMDAFKTSGLRLDGRRFFDKDLKADLYRISRRCSCCGKEYRFDELEVDHKTPWSKGGRTDGSNAQLLCKTCNRSKSSN